MRIWKFDSPSNGVSYTEKEPSSEAIRAFEDHAYGTVTEFIALPKEETLPAPATEEGYESWHLADCDIRTALYCYFKDKGFRVKPQSLALYGYGDQSAMKICEFQGHMDMQRKPDS